MNRSDGKFALDDPISKHLPEWKEPKVREGDKLIPARSPITPRMLMTHSSGLYYQLPGQPAFSGMPPRDENTTLEEYSRALLVPPNRSQLAASAGLFSSWVTRTRAQNSQML